MGGEWHPIGSDAKLRINNIDFDTVSGNWRETGDIVPRNNTGTGRKKTTKDGMSQFELDCVAQLDDQVSPHVANLFIRFGEVVRVTFAPFGFDSDFGFWDVPEFRFAETSGTWQVEGSQIQQMTVRGASDGDYFAPNET